jgi:hypothetical protein
LSGKVREQSKYYKLSAYETKPWGFEYRTPPAAIFSTPHMLRMALTYFRMCCIETLTFSSKHREEFMQLDKLPDVPVQRYITHVQEMAGLSLMCFYKHEVYPAEDFWGTIGHGYTGDIIPLWMNKEV